jgi:methyl-accepting chemotaxis protein
VIETLDSIQAMSADAGTALQQVQTLAEQSREIGKVLDVIRAIAEQTNLLALNAAIEAAGPGKPGAVLRSWPMKFAHWPIAPNNRPGKSNR